MSNSYRPEIDGLRAISVIAVLIYHASFSYNGDNVLRGGFIGVDIFFVISGYLICKIILREIEAKQFSFVNFYTRRARRILPALFLVMAVTLFYAWSIILPKEMKEFAGSGLSSLAFGSNFWFWQEDSYVAAPSLLKPLLHTWSLSVEEQFYVIFPIVVLVVMRYRWNCLLIVFFVLFVVSLTYAEFLSYRAVDANFFLIPSRAWELLAGSLLAANEVSKRFKINQSRITNWLPDAGLLMIIASFALIDDSMRHPSLLTLVPVLGCILIIQFGSTANYADSGKSPTVKLLASKLLRYVGLISYSLYLWHYPMFAFARIKGDFTSLGDKLEIILVSLVLAIVSYYMVEQTMRNAKRVSQRYFIAVIIITFVLLTSMFAYIYKTDGAKFRIQSNISDVVDFNYWNQEVKTTLFSQYPGCWLTDEYYKEGDPFKVCRSAELKNDNLPSIFLIGDSHAASLLPGLLDVVKGKANVKQRVREACLPLYGRMRAQIHPERCYDSMHSSYQEILRVQPKIVILAGRWRDVDMQFIQSQVRNLKAQLPSSRIILAGPLMYWAPSLPKLLKSEIEESPLEFPEYLPTDPGALWLDNHSRAIAEVEKVSYLSVYDAICENERCKTRVNNRPSGIIAWDHAHLTKDSSVYILNQHKKLLLDALR